MDRYNIKDNIKDNTNVQHSPFQNVQQTTTLSSSIDKGINYNGCGYSHEQQFQQQPNQQQQQQLQQQTNQQKQQTQQLLQQQQQQQQLQQQFHQHPQPALNKNIPTELSRWTAWHACARPPSKSCVICNVSNLPD